MRWFNLRELCFLLQVFHWVGAAGNGHRLSDTVPCSRCLGSWQASLFTCFLDLIGTVCRLQIRVQLGDTHEATLLSCTTPVTDVLEQGEARGAAAKHGDGTIAITLELPRAVNCCWLLYGCAGQVVKWPPFVLPVPCQLHNGTNGPLIVVCRTAVERRCSVLHLKGRLERSATLLLSRGKKYLFRSLFLLNREVT